MDCLFGTLVITLFGSYFEYGRRAHEPESTLRKCLLVLGRLLSPFRLRRPGPARGAAVCRLSALPP